MHKQYNHIFTNVRHSLDNRNKVKEVLKVINNFTPKKSYLKGTFELIDILKLESTTIYYWQFINSKNIKSYYYSYPINVLICSDKIKGKVEVLSYKIFSNRNIKFINLTDESYIEYFQ